METLTMSFNYTASVEDWYDTSVSKTMTFTRKRAPDLFGSRRYRSQDDLIGFEGSVQFDSDTDEYFNAYIGNFLRNNIVFDDLDNPSLDTGLLAPYLPKDFIIVSKCTCPWAPAVAGNSIAACGFSDYETAGTTNTIRGHGGSQNYTNNNNNQDDGDINLSVETIVQMGFGISSCMCGKNFPNYYGEVSGLCYNHYTGTVYPSGEPCYAPDDYITPICIDVSTSQEENSNIYETIFVDPPVKRTGMLSYDFSLWLWVQVGFNWVENSVVAGTPSVPRSASFEGFPFFPVSVDLREAGSLEYSGDVKGTDGLGGLPATVGSYTFNIAWS